MTTRSSRGFQAIGEDAAGDRFELLEAVGEVADDGTLLLGDTVQRLLGVVVPAFADVATLDAVGPTGELRRLGARVDCDGRGAVEQALLRCSHEPGATVGLAKAIATRSSELVDPVAEEVLNSVAGSAADLALLRSLALNSALFVPLRARGTVLGGLVCAVGPSGRSYSEADQRFVEVLAGRIALALDNAGLAERISGLERRLESTLANIAAGVLVRDAEGRMVFSNKAMADLLGVASAEAVTGAAPGTLWERFDVFDERGEPLDLDDLPSMRVRRGEPGGQLVVRNVVRETGEERWLLHKATPVFDDCGALSLIVSVVENVTDIKRAELAQRLLAQASRQLSASLDYQQTLQAVAQLAVPELADWCGVSIRGNSDILNEVAVAHVDPAKVTLAREFGQRYPSRLSDPRGAAEVIRSGQSQLVPEITDELLAAVAPELPQERLALVRDLQMRSVIIVPLALPGAPPIGTLSLVMAESGRTFDESDLAVAEELGRRAGAAVENARLYTERSRIAATLQASLRPPALPSIPGFRAASLYRAAGDQNEVGGDFYDLLEVPGGWLVLVGDVAGRGAEAAALTSLSRYTLRTAGKLLGDPVAAVEQLNEALLQRTALSLVSVCCAMLREHRGGWQADVVLAGHPPAYHVADGAARTVGVLAPLLGVSDDARWATATVDLAPGDLLVLYTDGVTDTAGDSDRFGESRLAQTLNDTVGAEETVRRIDRALTEFARGEPGDDTAVVVVERRAPERHQAR